MTSLIPFFLAGFALGILSGGVLFYALNRANRGWFVVGLPLDGSAKMIYHITRNWRSIEQYKMKCGCYIVIPVYGRDEYTIGE